MHSDQQILYACSVNQRVLCAKCILEPFYVDKLSTVIFFKSDETKIIADKMRVKWEQNKQWRLADWEEKKRKMEEEFRIIDNDLGEFERQEIKDGKIFPSTLNSIIDLFSKEEMSSLFWQNSSEIQTL